MLVLDWNIIWTLVNLVALYFLMKRFLFGPLNAMMEKRAELLRKQMEEAQNKETEAEGMKKKYEEILAQAHGEAQEVLTSFQKRGEMEYQKALFAAKADARRILQEAEQAAQKAKTDAIQGAREEIADLAVAAAYKAASECMDSDKSRQVVDAFLVEAGAAQ